MTTPQTQQHGTGAQRDLKATCLENLLALPDERVFFKDLLSRFLFASAGWIAAYAPGLTAAELPGMTDFDFFTYEHAFAAFNDEKEIIRTGKPIIGKVQKETFKGRPDAWVSTTKMPLRGDGGRIIGTFGISRVITAAGRQPVRPS
jgi:hypothetical protein